MPKWTEKASPPLLPSAPPPSPSDTLRHSGHGVLTDEQNHAVSYAREPLRHRRGQKSSSRVTFTIAAPGSGKTTMQEHECLRLIELGHTSICKFFFNKSAVRDGSARLERVLLPEHRNKVVCLTTHAAALKYALKPVRSNWNIVADAEFQRFIFDHFRTQIYSWVNDDDLRTCRLVTYWIFKSFVRFLHTWTTAFDHVTYYPAVIEHAKLQRCRSPTPDNFYCDRVRELWTYLATSEDAQVPIVHDVWLKWVQVHGLDLSAFSAVLLDEAQDLTECQLDAFVCQQRHADVFVVGDIAQSLYSWRGAASRHLASLADRADDSSNTLGARLRRDGRDVECTTLTHSFRFGVAIGNVANAILFVKEHSRQRGTWVPYRVTTDTRKASEVTRSPLEKPKTILCRTNHGIFKTSLSLLEDDPHCTIALLGDGESSARAMFVSVFAEMSHCLDLRAGRRVMTGRFAEFRDWHDFKVQVRDREMGEYYTYISLVDTYAPTGDGALLLELVDRFKCRVLDMQFAHQSSTADVTIGTVCNAKGLEWDRVELVDDAMIDLDVLVHNDRDNAITFEPSIGSRIDYKGDELNSWFVAATRAKTTLRLPRKWWSLDDMVRGREPMTPRQSAQWDLLDDRDAAVALVTRLAEQLGTNTFHSRAPIHKVE